MIDDLGERISRVSDKVNLIAINQDKELSRQKNEVLRQTRFVENAKVSTQAEKKKEGDTRYLVDGKHIVFEKYNERGDLILKIPRSHKHVDKKI